MRTLCTVVIAAILGLVISTATAADAPRVIGYFPEWKSQYSVDDVPAEKLTHINYAFALIKEGRCAIDNPERALPHFAKLRELKQKHPHLKTLISVGGWTGSPPFSDAALTEESRDRLAKSCADFAAHHGFDGVDIDWEFPGGGVDPKIGRPEDTRNFTLLLAALRTHLDRQGQADGKRYLLTIAAPAGERHRNNIELAQIHAYLDFINVMTYDFTGPWEKRTGHNAPLFPSKAPDAPSHSADTTIRAYLVAGTPADKLVIGVPFYGRAFAGVSSSNNGLFQPHAGQAKDAGETTYRGLAQRNVAQSPHRHWDDQAQVPWFYDPQSKVMITYDDPQSLRLKARYARDNKLGGAMFWELSHDTPDSALLSAIHEGLKSP